MITVNLISTPNQSFSIRTSDGIYWLFKIYEINGCMACDLTRDNAIILSGHRLVAGGILPPYAYLRGEGGIFVFMTDNDAMPWWENFGVDQYLVYLTAAEYEAI